MNITYPEAATSKRERFVITFNGWKPTTIITKRCILDVAAPLDPPLIPYIMCNSLILTIISIFVTAHKSLI